MAKFSTPAEMYADMVDTCQRELSPVTLTIRRSNPGAYNETTGARTESLITILSAKPATPSPRRRVGDVFQQDYQVQAADFQTDYAPKSGDRVDDGSGVPKRVATAENLVGGAAYQITVEWPAGSAVQGG